MNKYIELDWLALDTPVVATNSTSIEKSETHFSCVSMPGLFLSFLIPFFLFFSSFFSFFSFFLFLFLLIVLMFRRRTNDAMIIMILPRTDPLIFLSLSRGLVHRPSSSWSSSTRSSISTSTTKPRATNSALRSPQLAFFLVNVYCLSENLHLGPTPCEKGNGVRHSCVLRAPVANSVTRFAERARFFVSCHLVGSGSYRHSSAHIDSPLIDRGWIDILIEIQIIE